MEVITGGMGNPPDSSIAMIMGRECKKASGNTMKVSFRNAGSNLIQIYMFKAIVENKGEGTKAMKEICRIADENMFNLVLKPDYLKKECLIKFYSKFEFRLINDKTEMFRNYSKKRYLSFLLKKLLLLR